MKDKTNSYISDIAILLFSCLAAYFVIWAFAGCWPWSSNPYNSYALQAKAWLSGHMDLSANYSHLEIAEYHGKYFVSFPPLPSVLILPFVIFHIPDGFASLAVSLFSAFYTYKLCRRLNVPHPIFFSLFLVCASNILLISINPWVWFFAQNTAFLFTVMSLYYAELSLGGVSLTLLALAVGCRPFQLIYAPLIIYILIEKNRNIRLSQFIKWFTIPLLIGAAYMLYNYLRFGSPFEFGHNYLPEFVEAENGQFSPAYIPQNLRSLIRLPQISSGGTITFPKFNGVSVFLVFPIVIPCLVFAIRYIYKPEILLAIALCIIHILLITAHKTMGGFHFGNRYFIDVMPCLFWVFLKTMLKRDRLIYLFLPLFILGYGLNTAGIISMILNM